MFPIQQVHPYCIYSPLKDVMQKKGKQKSEKIHKFQNNALELQMNINVDVYKALA